MNKDGIKRNIASIFLTIVIISILVLTGPAHAIEINLIDVPQSIDVSDSSIINFSLEIEVNDGEFLPLLETNVKFSTDSHQVQCKINSDNDVEGCNFLNVDSKTITGLNIGQDFGYGYGYGYGSNNFGLQDFGYGYGYGYGTRGFMGGIGSGKIVYELAINSALLPSEFIDHDVNIEAEIIGGDENDKASFRGSGEFSVIQTQSDNDLIQVNDAYDALTLEMILNGNKNDGSVIADLKLPTSLEGAGIVWQSSDTDTVSTTGAVTRTNIDKNVALTANIQKGIHSRAKEFNLVIKMEVEPIEPDIEGKIGLNLGEDEVVIDDTNFDDIKLIEVPADVADDEEVVINFVSLVDNDNKLTLGSNDLTLSRESSTGVTYSVEIPQGTVIQGTSDWNGLITLPTVKANSEVTVSSGTPQKVIEVGSATVKLVFDKATKMVIPNQAGNSAGWELNDVFTEIAVCTAGQLANPDTLPAEGDCFTSVGSDLIIWTKHFTKFVSYTPTSSSGGTTSGGGGGSNTFFVPAAQAITTQTPETEIQEETTTVEEIPEETQTEGLTSITGGFLTDVGKILWNKPAKIIYGIAVALIVLVFVIVQMGGINGMRRKGKKYIPRADYY